MSDKRWLLLTYSNPQAVHVLAVDLICSQLKSQNTYLDILYDLSSTQMKYYFRYCIIRRRHLWCHAWNPVALLRITVLWRQWQPLTKTESSATYLNSHSICTWFCGVFLWWCNLVLLIHVIHASISVRFVPLALWHSYNQCSSEW